MDAHAIGVLLAGGMGFGVVVWVLHKIGKALLAVVEALAAVAVVFVALWWLLEALVWLLTQGRDSLADQPDRAGAGRVVAVVGLAVAGPHPRRDRSGARGVAVGGSGPARPPDQL
jgi:hypothetical protein